MPPANAPSLLPCCAPARIAERLEWTIFWLGFADENGFLSKEKVRGMYDGTLWETTAQEIEAKKAARRQLASSTVTDRAKYE